MKKITFLALLFLSSCAVAQDYKIPISNSAKFYSGDTVFFQVNDVNNSPNYVSYLFDEQHSQVPQTTFQSGPTPAAYYPATAVVDLGGTYALSSERFYTYNGTDSLYLLYGSPFAWSTDTLRSYTGGTGWRDFGRQIITRYLKVIYANKGYQKVRELTLYGHLIGDSLSRKAPTRIARKPTPLTMGQFIGFNQVAPSEVDSVGSLMRHYVEMQWMDTAIYTHNLDSILFALSIFGHFEEVNDAKGRAVNYFFPGGVDTRIKIGYNFTSGELHRMAKNGGYFDAVQGVPVYAKGQGKPIDKVNHPDYDAASPNSYDRVARMMWNYAAYYGSVKHPASDMQTPYPWVSGLGLRSIVEEGNEMNQDWSGRDKHFTPREYGAYASAFYDGNLGSMGPRMGVKNADPNMFVLAAGTAGASVDYIRGLQYYMYYFRKDHSPAFHALNFHVYATNGKNGEGTAPNAASPEEYFGNPNNPIYTYLNAADELFPGMPVWLTEWGYDRNSGSPLTVAKVRGKDSAQVQGDWIARWWIFLSFSGIQRSTIFQLIGNVQGKYAAGKFNSTGLTDGSYVADQYSPGLNATNYFAFPAYYYQRTLWLQLYNYRPDSIVYNNFDSVYMYRYRSADSVAYVIWSGTQTNRKVDYFLNMDHPGARVVQLADKHFTGIETQEAGTSVPLTISETPLIVFTTPGAAGLSKEATEPPAEEVPPVDSIPPVVSPIDTIPDTPHPIDTIPAAKFVQANAIIAGSTKAGGTGDTTITLPINSITMDASGSTGTIDRYGWGVLGSSPNKQATITGQGTSKATFSGLTEGKYIFFVNVSSTHGGWPSSSLMNVTVKGVPVITSITINYSDGSTETISSVGSVIVTMKDGTQKELK